MSQYVMGALPFVDSAGLVSADFTVEGEPKIGQIVYFDLANKNVTATKPTSVTGWGITISGKTVTDKYVIMYAGVAYASELIKLNAELTLPELLAMPGNIVVLNDKEVGYVG